MVRFSTNDPIREAETLEIFESEEGVDLWIGPFGEYSLGAQFSLTWEQWRELRAIDFLRQPEQGADRDGAAHAGIEAGVHNGGGRDAQ